MLGEFTGVTPLRTGMAWSRKVCLGEEGIGTASLDAEREATGPMASRLILRQRPTGEEGGRQGMPKSRLPREVWNAVRLKVLERDGFACTHCGAELAENTAHIDHIKSGKLGDNRIAGLRTLCRRCHCLRADGRHRGLIAAALRDGLIPPDWRPLVWGDEQPGVSAEINKTGAP